MIAFPRFAALHVSHINTCSNPTSFPLNQHRLRELRRRSIASPSPLVARSASVIDFNSVGDTQPWHLALKSTALKRTALKRTAIKSTAPRKTAIKRAALLIQDYSS